MGAPTDRVTQMRPGDDRASVPTSAEVPVRRRRSKRTRDRPGLSVSLQRMRSTSGASRGTVAGPTDGWLGFRRSDPGLDRAPQKPVLPAGTYQDKSLGGDVGTFRRAFDPREPTVPTDARRSALSSALRHATPSARGLVEILRVPHAAGLAAASWVARLPRGMAARAIVLLVHDATGSYAAAGAAGAALSIGDAGVS